jgi:Zn-finger nucleic acid-binding protein
MNAAESAHCSACGRDLGLEPVPRSSTLQCPDCRQPLAALACGPGTLYDCGRCGGQFVEHAALRDLIERHDRLDPGLARRKPSMLRVDRVRYVACPACGAMMNRRNFGGGSAVIVDVCAKHGTWFDSGELPRVLAFVEAGGLARVQAERRREEGELQRLREGMRPVPLSTTERLVDGGSSRVGVAIVDFLRELLDGFHGPGR